MKKSRYHSTAKKVTLARWEPIEAYPENQDGGFTITVGNSRNSVTYPARLEYEGKAVPHMPVILKGDGTPWVEANLYLIHQVEKEKVLKLVVNMEGVNNKADDLVDYLRFLEDENIDFTRFPRKKLFRPTLRYRAELGRQVAAGEIADTTGARRWGAVVNFYRVNEEQLFFSKPEYPPYDDETRSVSFTDHYGLQKNKLVRSTRQAVRVTKKASQPDTIIDGGQLKPLSKEEQLLLISELNASPNVEMKLMHWVALFTGARVQSVCTLRLKHAFAGITRGKQEVSIAAGPRTGIDTKNDKRITLQFPAWLLKKLQIYCNSERALKRRQLFGQNWRDDNYIFLSKTGLPFYKSKYDNAKGRGPLIETKQPLEANSVRQFVKAIRDSIRARNQDFYYRFHDLRATFGMNLVDEYRQDINKGEMTYTEALNCVKDRMGHSRMSTTESYLQYRHKQASSKRLLRSWESEFFSIIDSTDV